MLPLLTEHYLLMWLESLLQYQSKMFKKRIHKFITCIIYQIERLAQYERLVGGGCGRRRAARLSDLERVQDLFPHDYLALHDADAPSALASHGQVNN